MKIFNYYNYSILEYYTNDYYFRSIVKKVQLNILEINTCNKQSISNSTIYNKQAIIDLDLKKNQT